MDKERKKKGFAPSSDVEGGIFNEDIVSKICSAGSVELAKKIALEAVERFEGEHPMAYTDFAKIRRDISSKRDALGVGLLAQNMMLSRIGHGVI